MKNWYIWDTHLKLSPPVLQYRSKRDALNMAAFLNKGGATRYVVLPASHSLPTGEEPRASDEEVHGV